MLKNVQWNEKIVHLRGIDKLGTPSLESLMIFLFIGLIAGWFAGVFIKGRGFGVLGDILVGIIGAEIGGWLFGELGLSAYGFAGAMLMAFTGAVMFLAIAKLVINISSEKSI